MKLIQLPDGVWMDPTRIRSIVPKGKRFTINTIEGALVYKAGSEEEAKNSAANLAKEVNQNQP